MMTRILQVWLWNAKYGDPQEESSTWVWVSEQRQGRKMKGLSGRDHEFDRRRVSHSFSLFITPLIQRTRFRTSLNVWEKYFPKKSPPSLSGSPVFEWTKMKNFTYISPQVSSVEYRNISKIGRVRLRKFGPESRCWWFLLFLQFLRVHDWKST